MINERDAFALLERLLGFRAEPTRAPEVVRALTERLQARGCNDAPAYERLLGEVRARAEEACALGDRLTVNETYFLRETAQLELIVNRLVPELLSRGDAPVRILSAGCSTGEEPYGIALLLNEAGIQPDAVEILGIDVSSRAVAAARRGRYSEWSLRNVSAAMRDRYFERDDKGYRLVPGVASRVRFELLNVSDVEGTFWATSRFDIVLCRNLLIYLSSAAIRVATERFASALTPGGALLLGHAETSLAGPWFEVEEEDGAFFFRKRAHPGATSRRSRAEARPRPPDHDTAARHLRNDGTSIAELIEPIQRLHTRVKDLAAELPPFRGAPLPAALAEELADVVELIQKERFAEALERVEARDADERSERFLLRIVILTNLGRTVDAARAARARLARLPACPFSHYLLGVCSETLLEFEEARTHYAQSAALDPAFAMALLRLGMLARRAGQPDEARRALTAAIDRFSQQGARTLLLYGGGFGREALASLCRAELTLLHASGGTP